MIWNDLDLKIELNTNFTLMAERYVSNRSRLFLRTNHGLEQTTFETLFGKNLLPTTDSLFLNACVVLSSCIPETQHTDGYALYLPGATVVGKLRMKTIPVTPVKEASLKQKRNGVGRFCFGRSDYETQTVTNLANVVSEAFTINGYLVSGITAVAKRITKTCEGLAF